MVIESYREEECYDEEGHQDSLITGTDHHQPNEANGQNNKFGCHHIGQDSSNKKPFLTLEERTTIGAVVFYTERSLDD